MTIANLEQAFYNINGVEFVEHELLKGRKIGISVGVRTGRFEAILASQEDIDEFIDIVDVHAHNSLCSKKRSVTFRFIPNNICGE